MIDSSPNAATQRNLVWHKVTQIACLVCLNVLPYCFLIANYLYYPGYIVPFLNHPIGRMILLLMMLLQITVVLLLIWTQMSQSGSLLKPKSAKHWLLASTLVIALSITVVAGPFILIANSWDATRQLGIADNWAHANQSLKTLMGRSFVDVLSEENPGIWSFQIEGLVFLLLSVLGYGFWLMRSGNKYIRSTGVPDHKLNSDS